MTHTHANVPEPDQQKEEESNITNIQNLQHVGNDVSSSENDSDEENSNGNMNGYQSLTLLENDAGISEFYADLEDSTDSEEEDYDENSSRVQRREITVDTGLVLNAMKGISLPGNNVPAWAEGLSDKDWNAMIEKTIIENQSTSNIAPDEEDSPVGEKSFKTMVSPSPP